MTSSSSDKLMREIAMRGYLDVYTWAPTDKEFFRVAYKRPSATEAPSVFTTKEVLTVWGTFVFIDKMPSFGDTIFCALPEHGDLGCPCKSCSLAATISKEKEKGWYCVEFKPT